MRAALDESCPELGGGIAYVVVATVVLADETATADALSRVLTQPGRKRPFQWHKEGNRAKERLVNCLIEVGAVAHVVVHYPTGRKKMEAARSRALHVLIPRLVADGVSDLVIESRDSLPDVRDRAVILDVFRDMGRSGRMNYAWRPKGTDRLLWLADGVCGAVSGFLSGDQEASYYEKLQAARVIGEPVYLDESHGP